MMTPITWAATAILVNQQDGYLEMGALSAAKNAEAEANSAAAKEAAAVSSPLK